MEVQHTPNQSPHSQAPTTSQETIFSDVLDTTRYQKALKTARVYLYIIAAFQVGVGIYQYSQAADPELGLWAGGVTAGLGVLFLVFAIWSYKKPAAAFMTALIVFVVAHVVTMIADPSYIYKGIILKVLVVIALVKGYKDAREVEKLNESVGLNE
jgi:hypothetical protein